MYTRCKMANILRTYAAVGCLLCSTIAQALDAPINLHIATDGSQSYPDASNTGVPPGTVLTASGSLTVTTAGAVIDARDISGSLTINAPNVTVRNSRIRGTTYMLVTVNSPGFILEDSELDCMDGYRNGMNLNNGALVQRVNIHSCENGFNVSGSGTVLDSYIHDLWTGGESHTDGMQFNQGASDIVIRHNTIIPAGNTSCIIMWDGDGAQNSRVWIEDNRLIGTGGSFTLYTPRQNASNIYINNNRFMPGKFGLLGGPTSTITEFKGNVSDDKGSSLD